MKNSLVLILASLGLSFAVGAENVPENGLTLSTDASGLKVDVAPRQISPDHVSNLTHGEALTVIGIRISWNDKPAVLREPEAAPIPPCRNVDEALVILSRNCAGCHLAPDHAGSLFLNKARLAERDTIRLIANVIDTRQMPPAHGNFADSSDGKALRAWLANQAAGSDR